MIVSCIANGMLSEEEVGETVYMAADCNHDGEIDSLDVDILEQAGILLTDVDQTKSTDELLETSSAYVEYLNLIDQTSTASSEENENKKSESGFTFALFAAIIRFIKKIIVSLHIF